MAAAPTELGYRLSFAQQRLWFLDQLEPGSAGYNMFEAYRLRGELDPAGLRTALADTVARHAALRTTFHARRGVPHQMIAEEIATPFESITLTGEADARGVIDRESRRPFALRDGPLLRMTLLRLGPRHHIVLVVIHHIVADDWSMDVFWRDLCAYYRGRTTGSPVDLAPLPIRYVDYAAWQRNWLRGDALTRYLDYWRAHLEAAPLILELPADHPRPARQESADAVAEFTLPPSATRAVAELARSAGATSFMALLAAFTATIAQASGRDDFVVGTFAGNRTAVEVEDLVGLFVNTLALRMRCAGDPTFAELLGRVRSSALGAYHHQELPFDHLVTALRPPRDLSRNPVVQVAFQSLGSRSDRVTLPGITSTPVRAGQGGNPFDLLVVIRENGDSLAGELHYRADLFTSSTARALADRFARVVSITGTQPDRRLSTVS